MLRHAYALALAFVVLLASHATAWSESGHHLVALLAFDELTEAEQQELLTILKAHPRYEQDFTPPEKIKDADRYPIGRAAYWPDVARKTPYDRPTWHYQLGPSLAIGDVKPPADPGPLPDDATLDTREQDLTQAIALRRKVYANKQAPPADRATALCWLGHLIGDIGQPLHAGSLYVVDAFPEGDRGGNEIVTMQQANLYAFWDGLLGGRYNERAIKRRRKEIAAMYPASEQNPTKINYLDPGMPKFRIVECRGYYAEKLTYPDEIVHAVVGNARFGVPKQPIDLSPITSAAPAIKVESALPFREIGSRRFGARC